MRTILCVSLLFVWATTAVAQFAKNDFRAPKQPDAKNGPAADNAAPAVPADGAAAGAPAANALFTVLDLDGDGVVSKLELRKAITSLKKLDTDNDGNITLAEATAGDASGAVAADPNAQFIDQWMKYDKNGDGRLTADEVPPQMKQMLQGVDQNGDGAIDPQELTAAADNMRNRGAGGPGGRLNGGQNGVAPGAGIRRGDNRVVGRFMQYDRNGDGRLTAEELPNEATAMLRGADSNQDGAIDASELQEAIAKMGDAARGLKVGPGNTRNQQFGPGAENPARNRPRP
jgi:Ca2+-binding EF-hand superfamily protein